jgi:peptidoglycan/LPS O-acetylase OafA/YrhL
MQIHNLDYLRAFAVICVLIDHLLSTFGLPDSMIAVGPLGRAGVLLFFVHTSLVLMQSMARMRITTAGLLWKEFLVRRAFRIYPLSILTVCAVTIFRIGEFDGSPWRWDGIKAFLSNILLTQNFTASAARPGPLWSLTLEIQMYLCLPLIFLVIRRRPERARSILVWSVAGILALFGVNNLVHLRGLFIMEFVPCFLAGVMAYTLMGGKAKYSYPAWNLSVLMAVVAYCGLRYLIHVYLSKSFIIEMVSSWLFCLAVGVLIPRFQDSTSKPWNLLAHGIAKYSYGLYLSHAPLMWLCFKRLDAPLTLRCALFVLLLTSLSIALYHGIEEPFIRMGK